MNVLIVDPSRTFHHLVGEVFGELGVRSIAATNLASARGILASQPVGYICSSLHFEDGTGLDLCRELRAHPEHTYTPFILLTSDEAAELRESAFKVGVTDLFEKVQLQALAVFLRRLSRQYERTLGNVLVVEDSVSQAAFYAKALEDVGLTVDIAHDGDKALDMLTQWSYDLIVMDLVIPGEYSGVSMINQIRRISGDTGDAPILALTAFDQTARRIELFYLGVNDYVSKPVSAEELVARSRNLIHSSRALRELRAQFQNSRAESSERLSHDPLTGLFNRWHFESLLTESLQAGYNNLALAVLDVQSLRHVNDVCGREAGDTLIKEIANALNASFPEDTCAYLGGARFALFTQDQQRRRRPISEQLQEFVTTQQNLPFRWQGAETGRSPCVGIVTPLNPTESLSDIFSKADNACHAASLHPNRPLMVYRDDNEAGQTHHNQHGAAQPLQDALRRQDFVLFHQPMLPSRPKLGVGCEILIRMRGPKGALVQPNLFLPAAELYGISSQLDRWVTSHVCEMLGKGDFPFSFASINLSALTLNEASFIDFLKAELARTGAAPQALMFEVPESAALSGQGSILRFMKALRDLGCRVALDNFGLTLNANAMLRDLPVDVIKVDGRFTYGLPNDPLNVAILRAAREITSVVGRQLCAQQVETESQLHALQTLGLDWLQGYAIS